VTSVLQCDAGNSAVKWRLLDGDAVVARGRLYLDDDESRQRLLTAFDRVQAVWIASVADAETERALVELLAPRSVEPPRFAVTEAQTAGLVNSYRDPARMGVDRWLAMLGARAASPRQRLCVIDAGSAVTVDLVAESGQHEGGFILPGMEMMKRALLQGTGRVRFEQEHAPSLLPGRDTASAVLHGAALAVCGAVQLALQRALSSGAAPAIYLCGGDGDLLRTLLALDAQYRGDLVFEGLQLYARVHAN
jgi:type III pantothenate kinase